MARDIALAHHERWDGLGYPRRLKGNEIPLAARIVAVADVYDALTNPRPYKESWTASKAVDEIKLKSGTHFDPAVVEAFLRSVEDTHRLPH
jgi:putative two-component system response regulator